MDEYEYAILDNPTEGGYVVIYKSRYGDHWKIEKKDLSLEHALALKRGLENE